jgi:hypothetical protein
MVNPPAVRRPEPTGDLAYLVAAGAARYRWAARIAARSLRRLGGFAGDIVILSDRRYDFGDDVRCLVVPEVSGAQSAKSLKLTARGLIDFSAYRRVLFIDCDIIVARPIETLLAQAHQEQALIATDDLRHNIGTGSTWRCLDPAEISASRNVLAVNSGCFAAPGHLLDGWLSVWENVLREARDRPGPGFDQPGLNACMIRHLFPVVAQSGLMWFPRCDPAMSLCDPLPLLIHFHGIDRHLTRIWKMRNCLRRLSRTGTAHPSPVPSFESA